MTREMLLILLTAACVRADSPASRNGGPAGTVLAVNGRDTVWLDTAHAGGKLLWTVGIQGRRQLIWNSRALHGAAPTVLLAAIDGDSTVDLFWTIDYEDLVGGEVVLRRGLDAEVAIATRPQERCRVPEMVDVNGDGWLDFISYEPGALDASLCHGDAEGDVCRQAYPTEWAVAHVQHDGEFEAAPKLARQFYRERSVAYANAASELRKSIATRIGPAAHSSVCNDTMVRALVRLAHRARELSEGV